jgi:ATP-dependent DNA helicase PIF1
MDLEINDQFKEAIDLLENTNSNIFLTGEAGTGKSTLLKYFRDNTKKNIVVLAPTGVAAVNIDGETIHSFFGFKPNITLDNLSEVIKKTSFQKKQLLNKLDCIVIDEISMVRADLLDIIDEFLKVILSKNHLSSDLIPPFGGLQMVFIGDLFQLPPIVKRDEKSIFLDLYDSPFFFSSHVIKNSPADLKIVKLETIYRQQDINFINILNNIRNGSVTYKELELINNHVTENFPKDAIYLTTTNATAEGINTTNLNQLETKEWVYKAIVNGNIASDNFPAEQNMLLKEKARVMLVNNDSEDRWINGTLGYIESLSENSISIKLDSGATVEVTPYTWEAHKTSFDIVTKRITKDLMGSFTQFPLKLAWAITIHKSQGKTFDEVVIDLGYGAFAEGQVYVALSRARSLDGIFLKRRIEERDIIVDPSVINFFNGSSKEVSLSITENILIEEKINEIIKNQSWCRISLKRKNEGNIIDTVRPFEIKTTYYDGDEYKVVSVFSKNSKSMKMYFLTNILGIESILD